MDQRPLVDIIVLTWNGKEDVLACLTSLQAMTYPNTRIIVVDNASTDGTVEAVRTRFPAVEVLVNATNLRVSGGLNVGLRHAMSHHPKYCALLNNDTIMKPDFLDHLVAAAEADPSVGMAAPKVYYHAKPTRLWYAGGKVEWWQGWLSHIGIREEDRGQYDTPGKTGYITGCCMLVSREVVESIGLLDESFYLYCEDADWSLRAARAGFSLAYVPAAVVWHKISVSTGGHLSWHKNWNKLKSQLRLMAHHAKPYHWLTIPFGIIWNIVASFIRLKLSERASASASRSKEG